MFQNVTTNSAGADATIEIVVMLLGAFLIGYIFRWVQNRLWGCEHCVESEIEVELQKLNTTGATVASAAVMPHGIKLNDLKIVEGIGPKIEELLHDSGIKTWSDLAGSDSDKLKSILEKGGDRFRMHEPHTWPKQASLAARGEWKKLEDYQNDLDGGK